MSNKFIIDKGVPIPCSRLGRGREKYPWDKLEVGDSFWCDMKQIKLGTRASSAGKVRGWKFISRSENGGTRIWRVS
jgi:hypothetical protein